MAALGSRIPPPIVHPTCNPTTSRLHKSRLSLLRENWLLSAEPGVLPWGPTLWGPSRSKRRPCPPQQEGHPIFPWAPGSALAVVFSFCLLSADHGPNRVYLMRQVVTAHTIACSRPSQFTLRSPHHVPARTAFVWRFFRGLGQEGETVQALR